MCSTALDYAKYLIASMNHGASPLLSAGSLDQMHTVSMPYGVSGWGYGFGWQVSWNRTVKVVHHGGGLPGYATYAFLVPWQRFGVVVLTNAGGIDVRSIAERVANEVLGRPLLRTTSTDPLPFHVQRRAVDDEVLRDYQGAYERKGIRLRIDLAVSGVNLVFPLPRGGERSAFAALVGPDLFLTVETGEPIKLLRGANGQITSLLAGGVCYSRM